MGAGGPFHSAALIREILAPLDSVLEQAVTVLGREVDGERAAPDEPEDQTARTGPAHAAAPAASQTPPKRPVSRAAPKAAQSTAAPPPPPRRDIGDRTAPAASGSPVAPAAAETQRSDKEDPTVPGTIADPIPETGSDPVTQTRSTRIPLSPSTDAEQQEPPSAIRIHRPTAAQTPQPIADGRTPTPNTAVAATGIERKGVPLQSPMVVPAPTVSPVTIAEPSSASGSPQRSAVPTHPPRTGLAPVTDETRRIPLTPPPADRPQPPGNTAPVPMPYPTAAAPETGSAPPDGEIHSTRPTPPPAHRPQTPGSTPRAGEARRIPLTSAPADGAHPGSLPIAAVAGRRPPAPRPQRARAERVVRGMEPLFDQASQRGATAAAATAATVPDPTNPPLPASLREPAAAEPPRVQNNFNVKVALSGSGTAGADQVPAIEDALVDALRRAARRHGLEV